MTNKKIIEDWEKGFWGNIDFHGLVEDINGRLKLPSEIICQLFSKQKKEFKNGVKGMKILYKKKNDI